MALTTSVLVTNVNNLSDARYCAGMGVDMISFMLDPHTTHHLERKAVQEIATWLSGVKVVGEFEEASADEINELIEALNLEKILVDKYLEDEIKKIKQPVILKVYVNKDTIETDLIELMELYEPAVEYFMICSRDFETIDETNIKFLRDLSNRFHIYLGFGVDHNTIQSVLQEVKPVGIRLTGGSEIRPGLKSFDELEQIFEVLED